ncbi:hypothetical protein BST81_12635 [Leptolyngbya sp. 'hensonii']|uniref:hypothetical protein n=1 Tax=Leptolyngbya sp. 'hensonii' TaxID=1922337 RepID=UPI00094FCC71|nr:hypothetical protein [Leptolyngbya sp. 'hensonii']OLP17899.1 hypothetical protein BST81_12635 [Leptolyngbya sp. 'hensonii']
MERGLLWLPLLGVFLWLAWAGWNEYQKVEAYQAWAKNFQKAKYDIYAVLGQVDSELTWGQPTRTGPIDLQTFSLKQVQDIRLLRGGERVESPSASHQKGQIAIEFTFADSRSAVQVPFSDIELASRWQQYLQREKQRLIA